MKTKKIKKVARVKFKIFMFIFSCQGTMKQTVKHSVWIAGENMRSLGNIYFIFFNSIPARHYFSVRPKIGNREKQQRKQGKYPKKLRKQ